MNTRSLSDCVNNLPIFSVTYVKIERHAIDCSTNIQKIKRGTQFCFDIILATRARDTLSTMLQNLTQEGTVCTLIQGKMLILHSTQKVLLIRRAINQLLSSLLPRMCHIHRKVSSQHIKAISRVAQMTHPLHLIVSVILETLVKHWHGIRLADNHISTLNKNCNGYGSCLSLTKHWIFTTGCVKLSYNHSSK